MLKTFVLHIWKESSASQQLVRGKTVLSLVSGYLCNSNINVISLLTLGEVLMGNGTACL